MYIFNNPKVAGFGKAIFIPVKSTTPPLPNMNVVILKHPDKYQAICIDIEIDAVGSSLTEARDNLKKALCAYTTQMVVNYQGDVKAAAQDIIDTAFKGGDLKTQLFAIYLDAKKQYLTDRITKEQKAWSKAENFFTALKRIFQVEPVQFNLNLAPNPA